MKWLLPYPLRGEVGRNYERWLSSAGVGIRCRGTAGVSALLLTGGGDVDPRLYGEVPAPETAGVRRERDEREIRLVREFLDAGKPVFGICRGIQVINVALGGKLIQHVPSWLGDDREMHAQREKGKDSVHAIRFLEAGGWPGALVRAGDVNSSHHQAVRPDALGEGLRIAAVSPRGVIEAVEGVALTAPVVAVQWHPERLPAEHPGSRELLRWMKELAEARGGPVSDRTVS